MNSMISVGSFFSMSPAMAGAYGLVVGTGLACIAAGWLEGRLFGGKFAHIADWFNGLLSIGLPVAFFALLLRFIFSL